MGTTIDGNERDAILDKPIRGGVTGIDGLAAFLKRHSKREFSAYVEFGILNLLLDSHCHDPDRSVTG